jgi:hypothetical protein
MWSRDRNERKGVSWFLISYHSVVLPQIVPAMFGMFVYKAAALVQVYRDNDDLKLVFPDSGEGSSDWDLCSSLSKVYDPSTLKPFHSRMRCFPKSLVGTTVCNSCSLDLVNLCWIPWEGSRGKKPSRGLLRNGTAWFSKVSSSKACWFKSNPLQRTWQVQLQHRLH